MQTNDYSNDIAEFLGDKIQKIKPESITDKWLCELVDYANNLDNQTCEFCSSFRSIKRKIEIVVVDINIELGQKILSNEIHEQEICAIISIPEISAIPFVVPLRDKFPQELPHMNLNSIGKKRSLCLFETSPENFVHIYNPEMLIGRIRWWMHKNAFGEFQDDDQPLDPILAYSPIDVIIPNNFVEMVNEGKSANLHIKSNVGNPPLLVQFNESKVGSQVCDEYFVKIINTDAVMQRSILQLPSNMSEFNEIYKHFSICIVDILKYTIVKKNKFSNLKLFIIAITPLIVSNNKVKTNMIRGFICESTVGEICNNLNISGLHDEYSVPIIDAKINFNKLVEHKLIPVNIHKGVSNTEARKISGNDNFSKSKFFAIGVGALGSQVVLNCARMGQVNWTLLDPDFIFPHNICRHTTFEHDIGKSKVEVVANQVNMLFGTNVVKTIHNRLSHRKIPQDILSEFNESERILDLSASIEVGRMLSDTNEIKVPVSSYFLTPNGRALVALHEGNAKKVSQSQIEMYYYAFLYNTHDLHDHLKCQEEPIRLGSCREVSVVLPQHRVGTFAGIASEDIEVTRNLKESKISIWSRKPDGSFNYFSKKVKPFVEFNISNWKYFVSHDVLEYIWKCRESEKLETGGILLGSVDTIRSSIYLLVAGSCPPDSIPSATSFERGKSNVAKEITRARKITWNYLTYIGEWHTHPNGLSNTASICDYNQLNWVAQENKKYLFPGVIVILGDNGFRLLSEQKENVSEIQLMVEIEKLCVSEKYMYN